MITRRYDKDGTCIGVDNDDLAPDFPPGYDPHKNDQGTVWWPRTMTNDTTIIEGAVFKDGKLVDPGIHYTAAEWRLKEQRDEINRKLDLIMKQMGDGR